MDPLNFKKVTNKKDNFNQKEFYEDNFDLINSQIIPDLNNKVEKVAGKGLSTNDFDNTYKQKIDVDIPAQLNEIASGTGITDGAISPDRTDFLANISANLFNDDTLQLDYILNSNGTVTTTTYGTFVTDKIACLTGDRIYLSGDQTGNRVIYQISRAALFDANDALIAYIVPFYGDYPIVATNVAYIILCGDKSILANRMQVKLNDSNLAYDSKRFGARNDIRITNDNIDDNTISRSKLDFEPVVMVNGYIPDAEGNVNVSATSKLNGKKCVCLGDSITGGQVAPDDYPTIIANLTGMEVINMGFSGANIAYGGLGAFDIWAIVKAIYNNDYSAQVADGRFTDKVAILQSLDWSTVDFVTIFGGTNDWNAPVALDNAINDYTDNDKYCFATAFRYILNRLLTKYPHLKILPITTMWRARKVPGDSWNVDATPNSNNDYLRDFAVKVQDIAKEFHMPSLDIYNNCGINILNHTLYLTDGLHPTTDKGIPLIGNKIAGKLMLEYS